MSLTLGSCGWELVMALEEEFECEIPDEEAEKIDTVGKAIDFIKENYGG